MTLLRDLPRFRYLWLSKAISSTGSGVGLIALVLFVASSGPGAVSLVLIGIALPLLAGPLAVPSPTGWTSAACWPAARPGRESSMRSWP